MLKLRNEFRAPVVRPMLSPLLNLCQYGACAKFCGTRSAIVCVGCLCGAEVNTDEDYARFARTRQTLKSQLDVQHAVKLHQLHTAIASVVVQSEVNVTSLPGHRSAVYYRSDLLCVCLCVCACVPILNKNDLCSLRQFHEEWAYKMTKLSVPNVEWM
jgi:hypothetical protein